MTPVQSYAISVMYVLTGKKKNMLRYFNFYGVQYNKAMAINKIYGVQLNRNLVSRDLYIC